MRLSVQPEYLNAVLASVDGHFSTARENFEVLIARAEIEEDLPRRNAHESIANNFSYFAWGIPCGL
ncbi:hypothetical protein [Undibacterium curvum]|uniref:Uncharacterized protein n=1 Tax=Undibacterium curvum TaxID=2762294 RepID=A0ABR7A142_9BURK|nr:hypothetical protein [Undibacterium curvum]MBC3930418.1 hypothetical protein [Undibacterium curvum]